MSAGTGVAGFRMAQGCKDLRPVSFVPALATLAAPAANEQSLLSIHHASHFKDQPDVAGRYRDQAHFWKGHAFARPELIAASVDKELARFERLQPVASLPRAGLFDVIAEHVSELFAISPFATGNRRVILAHAAQIAESAGFAAAIDGQAGGAWDDAFHLAFVHNDHRAIACLLQSAPLSADLFPQPLRGIVGLPVLPARDAPQQRRYLRTMSRARRALEANLGLAKDEALIVLERLKAADATSEAIADARHELAFLRSDQGPLFQAALLEACGYAQITPALRPEQSPLEIVREIAAAVIVGLNQQPPAMLERLAREVEVPTHPHGGSPHQDRLAAAFLANTASENREDQRFAAWQRVVEESASRARMIYGGDPQKIAAETNAMRNQAAEHIRRGDMKASSPHGRSARAAR